MRKFFVSLVLLAAGSLAAAQVPTFDVVSVKRDPSDRPSGIRLLPNGQINAVRVTLHDLILRAYNIHESQVIGGPAWLKTERFELVAKAAEPSGMPRLLSMLEALLVDRFALRARGERREMPVYVLLPLREDGRPGSASAKAAADGPNLNATTVDCAANPAPPVPNTLSLSADGWPPCGLTFMRTLRGPTRLNTHVRQSAVSIVELGYRLQPVVGRPVVDRSGLGGLFDVEYTYSSGSIAATQAGDAAVPDAPDVFTAVREQLGLKLESRREAIDVLVIESAALIEN
jgi:uncharacterized protein (TIGR03435 family)